MWWWMGISKRLRWFGVGKNEPIRRKQRAPQTLSHFDRHNRASLKRQARGMPTFMNLQISVKMRTVRRFIVIISYRVKRKKKWESWEIREPGKWRFIPFHFPGSNSLIQDWCWIIGHLIAKVFSNIAGSWEVHDDWRSLTKRLTSGSTWPEYLFPGFRW